MTEEEEGACSTSAAHHSAVALQGLLSSHGAAQVISKVSLMEKDLKRSQRTLSELRSAQQTAGADAEQAARAHEEALGAARLEAKEAHEAHGALEKECAAKDGEIERVTNAAAEHELATAAELQLLRESVEEAARRNAAAEADAAVKAVGAGAGTTAESASPSAPTLAAAMPPSPRRCSSARRAS